MLAQRVAEFGANASETAEALTAMADIASQGEGNQVDVLELYKKALEIRTRELGVDHPDVASTLNSLANFQVCNQRLWCWQWP